MKFRIYKVGRFWYVRLGSRVLAVEYSFRDAIIRMDLIAGDRERVRARLFDPRFNSLYGKMAYIRFTNGI